ncbi:hypothetical protein BaRGS_00011094 [Batillaria attramentaria]|uniref:Alpha-2-macroglobulin domain-containing protein n=1 Tax=Batillaria attramentaria TaxID=370345 RepID=A0ABD0LDS3_9CAEN
MLEGKSTIIGKDLIVEAKVKNISKGDRRVVMSMTSRSTRYWDYSTHDDLVSREKFRVVNLKPGQEEMFKLKTLPSDYLKKGAGSSPMTQFHVYACARDIDSNMPYSTQRPFRLAMPPMDIKGPEKAKSGEPVTVTASFTNPLPETTLTKVEFEMDGLLTLAGEDPRFELRYGWYIAKLSDVKPGETTSVTVKLKGETDEEEGQEKTMAFSFDSKELAAIKGNYTLAIEYVKPASEEKPAA